MSSVRVAVRVRPLNQREVNLNSHVVVSMHGKVVRISNPKSSDRITDSIRGRREAFRLGHGYNFNNNTHDSLAVCPTDNGISVGMTRSISGSDAFNTLSPSAGDVKEFPFHFCFWSCEEADSHFVRQEVVYHHMGEDVVKAAYDGYNACVFAYGQTGSGKTYSMMGSEEDPGLIPRICKNLFDGMLSNEEITYRVEVSYLEIYNEKVHDLLKSDSRHHSGTPGTSLRVREHPKDGPYVQGLSRHIANGYRDVLDLMEKGNALRTTASTNMNDTSSRSHAIFTILFTQANFSKNQPEEKYSKIHLVDLAGSERAHATGATGHRLKEGGSINKSLVLLGNVISTLSEKSTNKKVTFIPYRDSVLTWLLKDSLGGNSKTMMIATISPAACNYSETLSTLRYASRAKNIINRPEVNEDPNVKVIRELRAEIACLKERLERQGGGAGDMKERLQVSEARVAALTQAWTGRWQETMTVLEEKGELALRPLESGTTGVVLDSTLPYLAAISTDELSTGISLFHLKEGTTMVGSDKAQDIVLGGNGVQARHSSIDTLKPGDEEQADEALTRSISSRSEDDKVLYTVTLTPIGDADCRVNGVEIEGTVTLMHGGIVQFGACDIFRFNNPAEAKKMRREGVQNQGRALSLLSRSLFELNKMDDSFPAPINEIDSSIDNKRRELSEMEERLYEAENNWRREAQEKEAELEAKRKRLEELESNLEESRSRVSSEMKVRRVSLDTERYRNCHSPAEMFQQIQIDLAEKYEGIVEQEMERLNTESRNLEEQVLHDNQQLDKEEAELKEALEQKQKEVQSTNEELNRLQEDLRTLGQMKERHEVSPEEYDEFHSAVSEELRQHESQLGASTLTLDRLAVATDASLRALATRKRIAAQDAADARHGLEIREREMRRDLNRKKNEELATLVEELVKNSGMRGDVRPDAIPEVLHGDASEDESLPSGENGESTDKGKLGATENELMALTMQVRAAEESLMAEEQGLADKEEEVELKRWRLQQLEESRSLSLFVEEEVRRQMEQNARRAQEEEEEKKREVERQQQQHALSGAAQSPRKLRNRTISQSGAAQSPRKPPNRTISLSGAAQSPRKPPNRTISLEIAEFRRRLGHHAIPRSASTSSSDESFNPLHSAPSLRSFSPLQNSQSMNSLRPRLPSEPIEESWPKLVEVSVLRYLLRSSFVEYEIKVVVGGESWVVCRRYSLIREFHDDLRKLYPGIRDIEFPPRKMFWDSLEKVAQERVTLLETYFRRLVNYLQRHPYCILNPRKSRTPLCKRVVCQVLPILRKGEFDNTRFTTA